MPENWREVAKRVRNWGKWGDSDQIGTLNYITPEKIVAATRLVKRGRSFPLCAPFEADKASRTENIRPKSSKLSSGSRSLIIATCSRKNGFLRFLGPLTVCRRAVARPIWVPAPGSRPSLSLALFRERARSDLNRTLPASHGLARMQRQLASPSAFVSTRLTGFMCPGDPTT